MAHEPVALYDYDLPAELIAQRPLEDRAASRLLVLHRDTGRVEHHTFKDVLDYVTPGDLWIFNNTRVFPARVFLKKDTGADIELLFLEPVREECGAVVWSALARPGKRLRPGTLLFLPDADQPVFRVVEKRGQGIVHAALLIKESLFDFLDRHGKTPLPPYIKETLADRDRYQTVYARDHGSSAAPTAGLHFTPALLDALGRQAETADVTLHIGMDTFRPVAVDDVADHTMHTEFIHIPEHTAAAVCRARSEGRRVVAVGTTSVRALESWAGHCEQEHGALVPKEHSARTSLFIHRGYVFQATDAVLTNFHLPRSTLLVMISAFAGRDHVLSAYREAVAECYRFFSFGDAMLIV